MANPSQPRLKSLWQIRHPKKEGGVPGGVSGKGAGVQREAHTHSAGSSFPGEGVHGAF